jgi:hypothetical protein
VVSTTGRLGRGIDAVGGESPGKEGKNGKIETAAQIVGERSTGDGSIAGIVGRVLRAHQAVREQIDAEGLDTDSRPHQYCRGPWNRGDGSETVMGNVAFDPQEWVQVNVQGGLPAIQPSGMGIKGVGAGAAVSEESVVIAYGRGR